MEGLAYRITMAIAGFSPDEVKLTQHGPELIVVGQPEASPRIILKRSGGSAPEAGNPSLLGGLRATGGVA